MVISHIKEREKKRNSQSSNGVEIQRKKTSRTIQEKMDRCGGTRFKKFKSPKLARSSIQKTGREVYNSGVKL